MRSLRLGLVLVLTPSALAQRAAVTIGYTSFEEPTMVLSASTSVPVGKYYDRRGGETSHDLLPEPLQNPVAYVACSSTDAATHSELGFRTFYTNTRLSEDELSYGDQVGTGMADGAQIGVIGDTTTPQRGDSGQGGPAPDGTQYYMLSDTDGFVYVAIDAVDVSDYTGIFMSAFVHVEQTTWEQSDYLKVWADVVGGSPRDPTQSELVLLAEHDLDQEDVANVTMDIWREYSASLPEGTAAATMKFGLDSDSLSEEVWFDYFRITGAGPDRSSSFCSSGCPANAFRRAGSSVCEPCAPGQQSAANSASCTPCMEGSFGAAWGGCTPCVPAQGSQQDVWSPAGSVDSSACRPRSRVIGFTSFEEPTATGGTSVLQYHDLLGGDGDHYLLSVSDQNPVSYTACSNLIDGNFAELGFKTFYHDTGAGGVADGAKIGVIGDVLTEMRGDVGQGGVAPDGRQYYTLEDTSGFIWVEMDPVYTGSFTNLGMSAWVHIESASWEDDDRIKLWAEGAPDPFSSSPGQEVILLEGTELDSAMTGVQVGNVTINRWAEYTAQLAPDTEIVMRFGLMASDSSEECWVDYFRITGAGPDIQSQYCSGDCPSGSFRGAGAQDCTLCAPGTASADGMSCLECEPGTYSDTQGAAQCTPCPVIRGAESTSPRGASSESLCVADPRRIGYTSFEEPEIYCLLTSTFSTTCSVQMYYDKLGEDSDHWLADNMGQNPVQYTACSSVPDGAAQAELGFRTFYHSNDPDEGMAAGAKIGVIGDISTPQRGDYSQGGPAPHGSQYYMIEDSDGFVYVEIDIVDVSDYTGVEMSGWAHIESATWEDTDQVKMWATDVDTGVETVLMEGTNLDIAAGITTGNITEDNWVQYSSAIEGATQSVIMRFGVAADDTQKETWWDYFQITGFGDDRSAYYCGGGGDVGSCLPGTFRGAGMLQCQPCQLGETSTANAGACSPCPPGTYAGNFPGQCQDCPADPNAAVTSPAGSTSAADCYTTPRTIGYTSFEEVPIVGGATVPSYTDPLTGTDDTDHYLASVDGDNPINWIPCSGSLEGPGRELGFRTHYFNEDVTLFLGNANIGVIGDTTTPQAGDSGGGKTAPDGSQYFMLENTNEGFIRVEIDAVLVSDYTAVEMTGWVQIESTLWEETDQVKIWASDELLELETVLVDAHDIDEAVNVTEDTWREYNAPLSGYSYATMNFGLMTDSSFEEAWFDYFRIIAYGPDRAGLFCSGCPAGQYRGAGAVECTTCPPGTMSSADSAGCTPCAEGTYSSRAGSSMCTPCSTDPFASVTSPVGSTSVDACIIQRREIGFTSFEEPSIVTDYGCNPTGEACQVPVYFDTLSTDIPHYLINNPSQSMVAYSACSMWNATLGFNPELGFKTHFMPTGSADWEQGAKVGVIGDITTVERGAALAAPTFLVS